MIPSTMHAVLLTGHGGFDKLDYRSDMPTPKPKKGEVLVRITAAGINNTDINTRIGWYSKAVTQDTNTGGLDGFNQVNDKDAGWSGTPLAFPRIQGADICGYIVAVGVDGDKSRIDERVIIGSMIRTYTDYRPYECWTIGSEFDGGFAQFVVAPARETYKVTSDWSDVELASIPCAYSTAENMLHRAGVGAERILITGASGGVGSAAVQLAKRRGAYVIALTSPAKMDNVRALGADEIYDRDAILTEELGRGSVDVVLDVVGGPQWPSFLEVLTRGGRYAIAGAIAGPISEIDLRTLYLKDLTLLGCTFQAEDVFANIITYIENNEIRPLVSKTYPLSNIVQAQKTFLAKQYTGKIVLIPPQVNS